MECRVKGRYFCCGPELTEWPGAGDVHTGTPQRCAASVPDDLSKANIAIKQNTVHIKVMFALYCRLLGMQ